MPESRKPSLHASSSEAVTNSVRVEVQSHYAPDHSQPFQCQWFFHYTVTITNEGDDTVQLLSRHWIITDAVGQTQEVRGPGVVGEQPVLAPGESFTYTSGCPLKTPSGVMRGT
jgi:ApaG protein